MQVSGTPQYDECTPKKKNKKPREKALQEMLLLSLHVALFRPVDV